MWLHGLEGLYNLRWVSAEECIESKHQNLCEVKQKSCSFCYLIKIFSGFLHFPFSVIPRFSVSLSVNRLSFEKIQICLKVFWWNSQT